MVSASLISSSKISCFELLPTMLCALLNIRISSTYCEVRVWASFGVLMRGCLGGGVIFFNVD